jgi:hypothetical protein
MLRCWPVNKSSARDDKSAAGFINQIRHILSSGAEPPQYKGPERRKFLAGSFIEASHP